MPEYKYRMAVDHAITISDHADFKELVEIVEKSFPEHIYTIYGYNIRLAAELRKIIKTNNFGYFFLKINTLSSNLQRSSLCK
ncbi:MAG: hypothetical protein ACTSSF_10870 [Candidatus Heimdallarchaeaceae archaeon]